MNVALFVYLFVLDRSNLIPNTPLCPRILLLIIIIMLLLFHVVVVVVYHHNNRIWNWNDLVMIVVRLRKWSSLVDFPVRHP
jgi:hypothetical protein